MRIGISVLSRAGQSIWQNGLGQNVVFLAQLFQRLPFVQSVVLIDVGSEGALPPEVDTVSGGLRVVNQQEATDLVDVVFEAAGNLDSKWLDLMRRRGCKVVFYCCGQPYVGLVEPATFDRPVYASRPKCRLSGIPSSSIRGSRRRARMASNTAIAPVTAKTVSAWRFSSPIFRS
jgi:hypothetical protein